MGSFCWSFGHRESKCLLVWQVQENPLENKWPFLALLNGEAHLNWCVKYLTKSCGLACGRYTSCNTRQASCTRRVVSCSLLIWGHSKMDWRSNTFWIISWANVLCKTFCHQKQWNFYLYFLCRPIASLDVKRGLSVEDVFCRRLEMSRAAILVPNWTGSHHKVPESAVRRSINLETIKTSPQREFKPSLIHEDVVMIRAWENIFQTKIDLDAEQTVGQMRWTDCPPEARGRIVFSAISPCFGQVLFSKMSLICSEIRVSDVGMVGSFLSLSVSCFQESPMRQICSAWECVKLRFPAGHHTCADLCVFPVCLWDVLKHHTERRIELFFPFHINLFGKARNHSWKGKTSGWSTVWN